MRRGALRGGGRSTAAESSKSGGGGAGTDSAVGQHGGEAAQGIAVCIEDLLEAGPQQHVCCVDVAIQHGNFAALQNEGEAGGEAQAEQDAEGVEGL